MLWQDLRFGLRMLRKSSGFTIVAVLTLALGIGATTAIFTLVQQVMLRSLPVTRPDELWRIGGAVRCCHANGYTQGDDNAPNHWSFFSWEAYRLFRAHTPAFADLAALQVGNIDLGVRRAGSSAPVETHNGEYVSGNFFRTFGVSGWRGRVFDDADDQEGMPPVAVLSFHTWQGKYGSDPSVVGAAYQINGHPFTIVGVAPPGFFGAKMAGSKMPDFWLPLATEPLVGGGTTRLKNPSLGWLDLIGRVRPGTHPKTLEAQLQVELHQWLASHAADMTSLEKSLSEKQTLELTPGGAGVALMREEYKDGLLLLLVAAVSVLLVACANIANLLLARGLKDRPQTAIRAALGASRARLVRKALTESLTLSSAGAVAGIALAYAGARLILRLAFTADTWVPIDPAPSMPVLAFALGISVMTGVVFGILPAWMTSNAEPIEALRGASRSAGSRHHWAQKTMVVVQTAASVVLLSAAAMLGQSLRHLEHRNFGFDTNGRYLISVNPMLSSYKQEQLAPLFREIGRRVGAVPGVRMASPALYVPMSDYYWEHDIRIAGQPEPDPEDDVSSGWTRVTPGFFETLGDRIVAGRPITDEDNGNTRPVAVVTEGFAKRFFGKENPIGRHFGPAPPKNAAMYEIVGVAADIGDPPERPMYFLPEAQTTHFAEAESQSREVWSHYLYNIVVWAPGNPPGLEAQLKRELASVDPNLVMYGVQSFSDSIHAEFAQQRMIASLTWLFGAVGLVLAAVGLYGVTAYGVDQRTREIGVRMALGATRASVYLLILKEAGWLTLVGLVTGLSGSIAAGVLMRSLLFGVGPGDLSILGTVAGVLTTSALLASYIPARRAARVDPMVSLRYE